LEDEMYIIVNNTPFGEKNMSFLRTMVGLFLEKKLAIDHEIRKVGC
jgi:hypothetical protein